MTDKLDAPGGASLLSHIGYIYVQVRSGPCSAINNTQYSKVYLIALLALLQEAKSHSGRFFGLESFVTGIQETGHYISEAASVIK